MLCRPLLAACLVALALVPTTAGAAGSSSVALSGADRIDASSPTSTTLAISLTLQGVVCAGEAEIPVILQLPEIKGMQSASLSWEKVTFKIAGHQAATSPWRGTSEVMLRLWGSDPSGRVTVAASYALPPQCNAIGGATTGETKHAIDIVGPEPMPARMPPIPQAPPAAPKSESLLAPAPSGKPTVTLPMPPIPVLFAILGMIAGGGVVLYQRMRALPRVQAS